MRAVKRRMILSLFISLCMSCNHGIASMTVTHGVVSHGTQKGGVIHYMPSTAVSLQVRRHLEYQPVIRLAAP